MRIACPNCRAVYNLPPALADARRMRCARCRHEFAPQSAPAPASDSAPESAPESAPALGIEPRESFAAAGEPMSIVPVDPSQPAWTSPTSRPTERLQMEIGPLHRRPRPAARNLARETALALAVSVLVLGAALAAGYVWRAQVMTVWPPSQRLYALLNLA